MEIHFSHVLVTACISASSEKFQKHLNLKCLFFLILLPCYGNTLFPSSGNCMCFSIIFPYNGNPLFPYFGNCMYFCIQRKISETLKFEMFVFSHIFPLLWEFTFPIFWELHGFLLHPKYLRNF